MINDNTEDNVNGDSSNEFGKIGFDFDEKWKHIDTKESDGELIVKWVGNWTGLEGDNFIAKKIFDIFIEYHQEFADFNEENQEKIKKTVIRYLMQDEDFSQRLSALQDNIINNKQCSRPKLVQVLQESFKSAKFNRKQYELEIRELERIGLIELNSSEQVIVHPIYKDILDCNEILQRIEITSAPKTLGRVIRESSREKKVSQLVCLFISVIVIIPSILFFIVSSLTEPRHPIVTDNPNPSDLFQEDCQYFRSRLRDINNGEQEKLVDRRDSLIEDIDKFQQTNSSYLSNLCKTPGLDTMFAELLRNQAFRLAGSARFIESDLIRSDGEFTKYGAVRCLCLIPEELPDSETFNYVQDKMDEWKRSGQGEKVREELEKIEFCPADRE
ncbi:MAG: hypothetical protein F6J86_30230 [Symploca sp. SIO1B1]|nr:hypothetical protein [Symploca sp. SIO1C2]NER98059.1 hypothetical protein [Symploca sp. SIO1B1]